VIGWGLRNSGLPDGWISTAVEYRYDDETIVLDLVKHDIGKLLDHATPDILMDNRMDSWHDRYAIENLLNPEYEISAQAGLLALLPIRSLIEFGASFVEKTSGRFISPSAPVPLPLRLPRA
jgi:hypothetical protein